MKNYEVLDFVDEFTEDTRRELNELIVDGWEVVSEALTIREYQFKSKGKYHFRGKMTTYPVNCMILRRELPWRYRSMTGLRSPAELYDTIDLMEQDGWELVMYGLVDSRRQTNTMVLGNINIHARFRRNDREPGTTIEDRLDRMDQNLRDSTQKAVEEITDRTKKEIKGEK